VSRFKAKNIDKNNFTYEMEEMTDYCPWRYKNDPIQKVINFRGMDKFFFALAKRKSGMVDIYANMDRLSTIEEPMADIDFDSDTLYIKKENGDSFKIPVYLGMEVSWH
jgi:hypothetical protein